jgi:hypothetical protein
MMAVMAGSFVISGLALWAYRSGRFWAFMLIETLLTTILYCWMRRSLARASWPAME